MAVAGDATSVQVNLLSLLINDDSIVRAVAVDNPDFLNADKYPINDTLLVEKICEIPRQIIRNGEIYRHALKMERIMPYMYDEKSLSTQGVYILYGVTEAADSRDRAMPAVKSGLLKCLYLDVQITVHHNLIDSFNDGFSGTRIDFITDRIIELIDGRHLGRNENKSFSPFYRKDNTYFASHKGRWHGRKVQFKASSLNVGCGEL